MDEQPSGATKVPTVSTEDAYTKGFKENEGRFLVAGTLYRPTKLSLISFIISNTVIGISLIFLYGAVALSTDSLALLFETSYWAILLTAVFIAQWSACSVQHRFPRIFTALGNGIYTYNLTDEETALGIHTLRSKRDGEKAILTKTSTIVGLACAIGYLTLLPTYNIYTGKFFAPQRSDGLIEGLASPWWFPIKIEDDKIIMARIVIMVIQCYIAYITINVVIAIVSFDVCVGHTLLYEFKVLALAISNFEKRAKFYTNEGFNKMELKPRLRLSLKEAIQHHKVLLGIVDDYVGIYVLIMLIFVVTITVLMCLSGVSLISDIPFGGKVLFFVFTITELSSTFLLCCYGQILLNAHELVGDAIYCCSWIKYSSVIKDQILITMMRTQRPLSLSLGGFTPLNLDTYSQISFTIQAYWIFGAAYWISTE